MLKIGPNRPVQPGGPGTRDELGGSTFQNRWWVKNGTKSKNRIEQSKIIKTKEPEMVL